jgi:hypothetical protein
MGAARVLLETRRERKGPVVGKESRMAAVATDEGEPGGSWRAWGLGGSFESDGNASRWKS